MTNNEMIRMANQIGGYFKAYGADEAKKEVAAHINNFWEPRMREQFFEYLESGGNGLDPLVMQAASLVRKPTNHSVDQASLPKHGEES